MYVIRLAHRCSYSGAEEENSTCQKDWSTTEHNRQGKNNESSCNGLSNGIIDDQELFEDSPRHITKLGYVVNLTTSSESIPSASYSWIQKDKIGPAPPTKTREKIEYQQHVTRMAHFRHLFMLRGSFGSVDGTGIRRTLPSVSRSVTLPLFGAFCPREVFASFPSWCSTTMSPSLSDEAIVDTCPTMRRVPAA